MLRFAHLLLKFSVLPAIIFTIHQVNYNPKSTYPSACSTHRAVNNPHTIPYTLLPYVAMMFKNMRLLGVIF